KLVVGGEVRPKRRLGDWVVRKGDVEPGNFGVGHVVIYEQMLEFGLEVLNVAGDVELAKNFFGKKLEGGLGQYYGLLVLSLFMGGFGGRQQVFIGLAVFGK